MLCKFLEKCVQIKCDGFGQKPGDMLELEYYLLESVTGDENDEMSKTYGVEIVKKQNGCIEESKRYEDVFQSREKTKSLVELLAEQTVTPSALPYILDDLIGI